MFPNRNFRCVCVCVCARARASECPKYTGHRLMNVVVKSVLDLTKRMYVCFFLFSGEKQIYCPKCTVCKFWKYEFVMQRLFYFSVCLGAYSVL